MEPVILLVASNQNLVSSLLQKIADSGYESVDLVKGEEEARKKLSKKTYSLAIIDLEQNNFEAALQTGAIIGKLQNTPLIYMGEKLESDSYDQLLKTRPWAFLTKPVNWIDFRIALENILRRQPLNYAPTEDLLTQREQFENVSRLEKRWHTLLNNLPGMAYRCLDDEHWTMLFLSQGCSELTGYEPSDLVLNKKTSYQDLIHPDDKERVRKEIEDSSLEQFELSYRVKTSTGMEKWVLERGIKTRETQNGKFVLEGVIVDIDEQMQAKLNLHLSLSELKILNNLNISANGGISIQKIISELRTELKRNYGVNSNLYFLNGDKTKLLAQNSFLDTSTMRSFQDILGHQIPDTTVDLAEGSWHRSRLYGPAHYTTTDDVEIQQMIGDFELYSNLKDLIPLVRDKIKIKSVVASVLKQEDKSYGLMTLWSNEMISPETIQSIFTVSDGVSNIISRRVTEEKLIKEEYKFRTLWEMAPNGIVTIDIRGYVRSVNRSFCLITGYSESEVLNKHIRDIPSIPKNSITEFLAIFTKLFSRKRSNPIEFRWVHKNGTLNWGEAYISLLKENGKATGIQVMINDITSRKGNELRVKESEDLYRTVITKSPMSIILFMDGKIVYTNPVLQRLMGVKNSGQLVGAPASEIVTPEYRSLISERMNTLSQNKGNKPTVFKLNRQDQKEVFIESSSVPVLINGEKASLVMGRDITRQKASESTLKENEERYRTLFENMAQGVFYMRSDGTLLDVNTAALKMLGLTRAQFLGKKINPAQWIFIDENMAAMPEERHPAQVSLRTGEKVEDVVVGTYNPKLKKYVWLLINTQPQFMAGEIKPFQVFVTLHDLTEIKTAEIELNKSYREIKKLSRHTEEIREEERKQIARNLHDELGQILTAIKMDVSWIKSRLPENEKNLDQRADTTLDIIDQAIGGVQRITSELRPPILDNLGLFEALRSLIKDFQNRTGIKTNVKFPPEEPPLNPDFMISIYRIIQEALTNVIRHSQAGHVGLTVKEKNNNLEIQLKDNGSGIPEEKINSSDSLGLIGIKERVLRWEGTFQISGKAGEGTSLNISFPISGKKVE